MEEVKRFCSFPLLGKQGKNRRPYMIRKRISGELQKLGSGISSAVANFHPGHEESKVHTVRVEGGQKGRVHYRHHQDQ
jgi:hypothetical protein